MGARAHAVPPITSCSVISHAPAAIRLTQWSAQCHQPGGLPPQARAARRPKSRQRVPGWMASGRTSKFEGPLFTGAQLFEMAAARHAPQLHQQPQQHSAIGRFSHSTMRPGLPTNTKIFIYYQTSSHNSVPIPGRTGASIPHPLVATEALPGSTSERWGSWGKSSPARSAPAPCASGWIRRACTTIGVAGQWPS